MHEQWIPWIAGAIVIPVTGFALKWLIGDWYKKKTKLEEFKEANTNRLLNDIRAEVKTLVTGMKGLSEQMARLECGMKTYGERIASNEKTIAEVGEKIRKNVLDNRNVSRNIKQEVINIMRDEMPKLVKEFGGANEH